MDAKEAFYAVLRTLVVPITESDEAVAWLFQQLALPQTAMVELKQVLAETSLMEASELPASLVDDVTSTYTATHFHMQGGPDLALALKGTRPGHPYADIVFAFAFQKVLALLAQDLDRLSLRPCLPTAQAATLTEELGPEMLMPLPSFCDDFIIPFLAPTPAELHANMTAGLDCTGRSFARRGMVVNDKPGKTEAIIEIFATGPTALEQLTALQDKLHISASHPLYGELAVQVVQSYKHLGGMNAGAYRLEYEAIVRAGYCKSAFQQLRRKLFRNPDIPAAKRTYFWKALCLSKLLHHVSTWCQPTEDAMSSFSTGYHHGPRVIAGCKNLSASLTNQEVRVALNLAHPIFVIHKRRLGLLRRVLAAGAPWMLGLYASLHRTPRTWAAQTVLGLDYLCAHEPGLTPPLAQQLQECAASRPQAWKTRLAKLQAAHLHRQATEHDVLAIERY